MTNSSDSSEEKINGIGINRALEKDLTRSSPVEVDPFKTIQDSNVHVPFTPKGGTLKINYFPRALIELNKEIEYHGKLRFLLAQDHAHEWETRFAHIAAYCGVAIDGYFSVQEIERLAETMLKILYQKRLEDIH